MTYVNRYTAKPLVKKAFNLIYKNNRTNKRYCSSMLPAKSHVISIPFTYFVRIFNLEDKLKKTRRELLNRMISVNGYKVKDKKFPVAIGDYVQIDKEFYVFQMTKDQLEDLKLKKVNHKTIFPIVSYQTQEKGFLAVTRNGLSFPVDEKDLPILKKLGSYVLLNLQDKSLEIRTLIDSPTLFDLIKLTGKDALKRYHVLSVKQDQSAYAVKILDLKGQEKNLLVTRSQLVKRFTFVLKEGVQLQ